MNKIGQPERETQNRVVQLFQNQLNYRYLGNWQDRNNNRNIEIDILQTFLKEKQGYSDKLISKALYELGKVSNDQSKSLYFINKAVYRLLRYGIKVKADVAAHKKTVWLINWNEPLKNDFAIAEEVTIKGENTKRPDIVLYINGIALGVIELKRSTVSVSEGIRQNLDNQEPIFIKAFFATQQLLMAGNDTQGLRYGTIETPEKYYLTWKEDSHIENPLDRHITQICKKECILEIIHDFIVFDRGIKKLCRPNQYFGVKAAQKTIKNRKGGIIWHTQGSGKSLTMVWLTKWLREHIKNVRVLIITDRDELDQQIEKVFKGVNEDIYRTKSGNDLITKLNETNPWLLCSLIHKFGKQEAYDNYIEELTTNIPKNFRAKGDIYVFVDECHRTQSGKLHQAMKKILPNALLIGFTGTPLLKQDKQKSIEIFGPYIHTYKFDEAVADQVVLDLRYEARNIDQNISSQKRIDEWFEAKTKGLTEIAKTELKKRWGTLQKVLSSEDRLSKIVNDIWFDMATKDRLQNGKGNAMLVSGSIYQACKYYELFQKAGLNQCAIVTSYNPSPKDIKGESTGGAEGLTEKLRQYEIYTKMLNGKNTADFEKEVKDKFINEPAQMKLLIVVDKLLTGFDAPSATYLYLDKTMRDHSLFQAICRVNRLDGEDKEYGYIIDYKDLFKSLAKSVDDYTSEAFDQYEPEEVAGLLTNRLEKGKERLDMALETIKALCEPVQPPKDSLAYIRYFCGSSDKERVALYKYTIALIRAYANIANEMQAAGYSVAETEAIKNEVKYYTDLREEIKKASGDYIDLKAYEPAMRHLIDTYIRAEESEKVSEFDEMTLVQLIVAKGKEAIKTLPKGIRSNQAAVAETIENNLRKVITEEKPTNPKYFEKMSVLLNALIKERQEQAKSYEAYLEEIRALAKKINNPSATYPSSLNSDAKRALYDNLAQNEGLALALDSEIHSTKKDDWRGNKIKEREVKYTIKKHIPVDKVDDIFEIVKNQAEY